MTPPLLRSGAAPPFRSQGWHMALVSQLLGLSPQRSDWCPVWRKDHMYVSECVSMYIYIYILYVCMICIDIWWYIYIYIYFYIYINKCIYIYINSQFVSKTNGGTEHNTLSMQELLGEAHHNSLGHPMNRMCGWSSTHPWSSFQMFFVGILHLQYMFTEFLFSVFRCFS